MNESQRRCFAAQKANEIGYGGIAIICGITGLSRTTIIRDKKELTDQKSLKSESIRTIGGGRKTIIDKGLMAYGTYDVQRNEGFVNVGMSSDTAEFAVNTIWQW